MRKIISSVLAVLFIIALTSGCFITGGKSSQTELEQSTGQSNEPDSQKNEFSVTTDNATFSVSDWDDRIDFKKILGNPVSENVETLDNTADTFAGSFVKKLIFKGLELTLFSPKDNGKTFWIMSIKITDKKYSAGRGIKVGNSLAELNNIYPNAKIVQDGRTDVNNCAYEFENIEEFRSINFEVKDGNITEIELVQDMP